MSAVQNPIEKLERRLKRLKLLIDQREGIATDVINEVTVNEIKTRMWGAGYSIRIIDNVEVIDVRIGRKNINYAIFNELIVGEGFDIAVGMEDGIGKHDIFGNPVLVWQGQSIIGTPQTIFATHVKHPGVEASHIIRDTTIELQVQVQERYKSRIQSKIQAIQNSS